MTDPRDFDLTTTIDFTCHFAEGNPGALTFVLEVLSIGDTISRRMGFAGLNRMDALGIRGEKLYMLWNDCCDRDTEKTVIEMLYRGRKELELALAGGRGVPFKDEA